MLSFSSGVFMRPNAFVKSCALHVHEKESATCHSGCKQMVGGAWVVMVSSWAAAVERGGASSLSIHPVAIR